MSREREITAEVRALETLGLEALRAEWRRIIGPPPKARWNKGQKDAAKAKRSGGQPQRPRERASA